MPNNDDFWNSLLETGFLGRQANDFAGNYLTATEREEAEDEQRVNAAVEARMSGRAIEGQQFTSVRGVTDSGRAALALQLPVAAGTKVAFMANAGSVLAYDDPPGPGEEGVVVTVKSASGAITEHNGKVFVRWADGHLRAIHAEHLRPSTGGTKRKSAGATPNRIRVASLGDLSEFLKVGSETLVHKATRDLWSVHQDTKGYVIERLFEDNGKPLKV